jgi:hypothetical protein
MRGRDRALIAGLALLVSAGAAACGSSSTVGTADATTTSPPSMPVARIDRSCATVSGEAMSVADNGGAPSASAALDDFQGRLGATDPLRGLHYEPAAAPPPEHTLTSVGGGLATSATSVTQPEPSTTASPVTAQWYAHLDDQGRVTAVILVTRSASGWMVAEAQHCTGSGASSGAGAATATTGGGYQPGMGAGSAFTTTSMR